MKDRYDRKDTGNRDKEDKLRLSERLKLVASFVPEGSRIADIGTDHGYVPIYLAEIGKIKSALAMDVRKGPLARADEHIEEYRHDVGDAAISIETRLSNGLEKLQAKEADTVIIAGWAVTGDQHFRGWKAVMEQYPPLDLFTAVGFGKSSAVI